jgi:hypothetical protein
MLLMAIVLAFASLTVELTVVSQSRLLRRAVSKNVILNLIVSLGVSWILGIMFGAQGLTVLLGALLATGASIPIYRVINATTRTKENRHARRHYRRLRN